jgi:hypothetical protein
MSYQLTPPHCHRTNAAERDIITFKGHFKAGLAIVNPDFPAHLWDRILTRTTRPVNIHCRHEEGTLKKIMCSRPSAHDIPGGHTPNNVPWRFIISHLCIHSITCSLLWMKSAVSWD